MASRRRKIYLALCLAFGGILFCTWPFASVSGLLWPPDDWSHLLAKDALRAACDSVQETMWSLFDSDEAEMRATFKFQQNATGHWGTKFERLQASLDDPHRNLLLHDPTPQAHSGPRQSRGHATDTHAIDICNTLAGKRVTMIGGEHIYRLHVFFLQDRERTEGKLFPCPYHEFCTHHHICLLHQYPRDDMPTPRYVKPPTAQELAETESAVVNYIVSDALSSTANDSAREYTSPFVDPMTGVRLRETYWLAAARKANVLILGRGPLTAPGQTYVGNWSFLQRVPDYVDESPVLATDRDGRDAHHANPRSLEILNAAVHLTATRFLPDVFRLLRSIQRNVRPTQRKRLIWPSSWYRLPSRGAARTVLLRRHARSNVQDMLRRAFFHPQPSRPHPSAEDFLALQLSASISADASDAALFEDPWTLLFNAQVYLQNTVLRELLPRYGIVFLPLDTPWVETWARRLGSKSSHGTATSDDLARTVVVGEALLAGMDYVLRYLG